MMHLVQMTPGAGAMYCGTCLRDNTMVAAWRALGHQVTMVPLYLPLTLDEPDQTAGTPIFFGGINVYLEQKSAFFRHAPKWLHDLLASRRLLRWAAGRAAKTRAADLGELTLSMLRGETGRQACELEALLAWLKTQPAPDAISLSTALLLGMARRLRKELAAPVVCALQGEDFFLDGLPDSHRAACWQALAERAAEVDLLIAPSRYFAERMRQRLGLPPDRIRVVYNGINLDGYGEEVRSPDAAARNCPTSLTPSHASRITHHSPPVLGFFARMCPEKGLDLLVEAYITLRRRQTVPGLKLRIGGSCGPGDEPFVRKLKERLGQAGLLAEVEFCPNLDRAGKLAFLRSLSVFSVPALYGEAFGLYVLEALAAGVPVVLPRSGAFPELLEATGGGSLCSPGDPLALAQALEELLLQPERARLLAETGRRAVWERFNAETMARTMVQVVKALKR